MKLEYEVLEIPVQQIFFDASFNCRGSFTLESIESLAKSIKEIGLQVPTIVQEHEQEEYRYRLLAGHRRFKAVTTFLKWETIPAIVRNDLTERQARILNLTENLERKNLNIWEEARALDHLYPKGIGEDGGTSLQKVAREIKKPTRWVHVRARLLKLDIEIQKYAAAGWISAVNIEALWQLPETERLTAAKKIVKAKKTKGKTAHGVTRRFNLRKSKNQICELIAYLYNRRIDGLVTRVLAWAAGYISDEEIKEDIIAFVEEKKLKPRPHNQYLKPRISKPNAKRKRKRPEKRK